MRNRLAVNGGEPVRNASFTPWPIPSHEEEEALLEVFWSGAWGANAFNTSRSAPDHKAVGRVGKFQQEFANHHECMFGVGASSASAGLEVAIRALRMEPGLEVLVPAYTFITTATCVLQNNLVPIFVDIEPGTYNIDPSDVAKKITNKTCAIIAVHFAGLIANMDAILKIASEHGLAVLEDASQAHGAKRNMQSAGSFGDCGVFSFQTSKNMTSGEGGCLVTNRAKYADQMESLVWVGREHGEPWYRHFAVGWNYRMTEFQAAILSEQLHLLDQQNATREQNAAYLYELLGGQEYLRPLSRPKDVDIHSNHLVVLRYDSARNDVTKHQFARAVRAEGVPIGAGYGSPIYMNPVFADRSNAERKYPFNSTIYADYVSMLPNVNCPIAEHACAHEALWMPHQMFLGSKSDIEDIWRALSKVLNNLDEISRNSGA